MAAAPRPAGPRRTARRAAATPARPRFTAPSPWRRRAAPSVEEPRLDSLGARLSLAPRAGPCPDSRPWTPRPRSPSGRLPEPPNFAVFSGPGAEGLWGDAGAAPRARSRSAVFSGPAPREAPSPDPFGDPPVWGRARSPGGEQPPLTRPSSNSASSSSSSPAPPSGGESSSPSPWGCQGPGTRLSEGGTAGTPPLQSEPGAVGIRRKKLMMTRQSPVFEWSLCTMDEVCEYTKSFSTGSLLQLNHP
ncbi:translation initiation factor IF-2 [Ammospiza caudacuta]|uniref:translation initiation factor IF-2 n=1 Tax=Ammospiza caudacuta TaxID=2857398 RepID=UPI00273846BB|nr:translation initiation factor IF-2 [Ammospiza caudacuta]